MFLVVLVLFNINIPVLKNRSVITVTDGSLFLSGSSAANGSSAEAFGGVAGAGEDVSLFPKAGGFVPRL